MCVFVVLIPSSPRPPRSDTTTTAPRLQVSSHCHQQRGTQGQKVHLSSSLSHPHPIPQSSLSFSARCDSDDQQELCGRGLCVDPEYDVLWSYSNQPRPTIACYNPVTTNLKGILTLHIQWNPSPFRGQSYSVHTTDPSGTILSSSICLPHSKDVSTSRSHISLNLLSCLHTLATSPPLTVEVLAGNKMKKYEKDEYLSVLRFNGEHACTLCIYVVWEYRLPRSPSNGTLYSPSIPTPTDLGPLEDPH